MSNLEELKKKYKELGEEINRLENEKRFDPHNDKLFLLSAEEYNSVKDNIGKYCSFCNFYNHAWWLRSPSIDYDSHAYYVNCDADVGEHNVFEARIGVAPVFVEKTNEKAGTRKIKYGFPFVYIGNDFWISESFIFDSYFDLKISNYETSEIRQRILKWAEERE